MTKGSIPEDKIDEIKRRINIVDLVSGYVNLKQTGRSFIGLCPFHQEKTPSFTVNPDKQIFYCFGCGEGGNAITFVMKHSGLSFPEAVRQLAKKTGVTIPSRPLSDEERGRLSLREKMLRLHSLAAAYYAERLRGPEGGPVRQYLQQRGIGGNIAGDFRLGYSLPGWRHLRDYLELKKVPLPLAEEAGLLAKSERGDYYDRFRGRLIFPIEDPSGQIIAFGGRILGEGTPKYLNSPESALFSKSRNLYGLSKAREEIRRCGYVILVEGYFDLLALWNAGIKNVVATLGTALTREHVELLRRYTQETAVVFDGDAAGRKALARSLALFIEGSLHMRAVMLPDAADPDDFVRKFGKQEFLQLIDAAPPAVEYYLDNMIGSTAVFEDGRDALREAMSFIARMDNDAERNLFIKRVAERIGLDEEVLKAEIVQGRLKKTREGETKKPVAPVSRPAPGLEMDLISLLLDHPGKIAGTITDGILDYFQNEDLKRLGEEMAAYYRRRGSIELEDFFSRFGSGFPREEILSRLIDSVAWDDETVDRICLDMTRQIKRKWFKEKRRSLNMKLVRAQQAMDAELCQRLLAEKAELMAEERSALLKG
jgi:DNA primase